MIVVYNGSRSRDWIFSLPCCVRPFEELNDQTRKNKERKFNVNESEGPEEGGLS
ncbi:hypothetical protein WICANDRAFT_82845 [Wickerhamomyces anomalus NRRL Y-366-8]|uniref:Uncharacterized protein n=1 Tax=Wickerhamomyces anomalus (strain ATCC 58044 / CBS 1984 / NCYC 433 / NRRL Y-366-8) TaxID=683960 RepID=A0A1E3PC12_WICAA|nr:uncharacterized protein WICANDRAFT_82845 [Wickerhamomyces anomalus NRRL Y-366-8]ODQ62946.1 hypothetical protein WICANDRAFT_82845 [Wickerhamomyces anomalus NRRL Y-366-8]